jgi:hypothetical protein
MLLDESWAHRSSRSASKKRRIMAPPGSIASKILPRSGTSELFAFMTALLGVENLGSIGHA